MVSLLKDLMYHYRYISQNKKNKEEDWKALWQQLHLICIYCDNGKLKRGLFSSIKGYRYLFMLANTEPQDYYSPSVQAREVCIELARIVDIIGLRHIGLVKFPENSVEAFVHILCHLGKSMFSKIQSTDLYIYPIICLTMMSITLF